MVKLTCSLAHWLSRNYPEKIFIIKLGHTEEMTEDMTKEYLEWCKTDEAKEYFVGGSKYTQPV